METEMIQLTKFSKGSGCGCKIAPAVLQEILKTKIEFIDQSLIVGNNTNDDAAVYDLSDGNALISTVDFFTPIVNHAFDFGKIAAANSLSDVYAMGGKPLVAIAILGWPEEKIPFSEAQLVLDGARTICKVAGIALAGGHSIYSPEPFFGLSVNGISKKINIKTNSTAQTGDLIYLTKPLGLGVMATAHKRELLKESDYERMIKCMTTLNANGAAFAEKEYVSAMTDVTGFGLAGHLIEMCRGSGLSAEIDVNSLPILEGAEQFIQQNIFPDNTFRNWNAYEKEIDGVKGSEFVTLCDPQTSGGLLVSILPDHENEWLQLIEEISPAYPIVKIGKFTQRNEYLIHLK